MTQESNPQPFSPSWTSPQSTSQGWAPTPTSAAVPTVPPYRPAPSTSSFSRNRGRLAGLLAATLLVGGIGGGASGLAAASWLAPSRGVVTNVVQADASNPNWTSVAAAASPAVVAIQVTGVDGSSGQGSGVVIDDQGHIITNNHVVAGVGGRDEISVLLHNNTYAATIVGTDPSTDLAVIRLTDPPQNLTVLAFADSESLAVGDPVMAIGNPLGLDDTVTTGIVSALDRPVTTETVSGGASPMTRQASSQLVVTAAIQTNAAINPGNSGGALVNSSGQLVGITSSIATLSSGNSESGNIGIGFAIPSNQVAHVADQLITSGTAQHPQIGISANDVSGTGPLGAEVANVLAGSAAEQAGLLVGDVITAVDGSPVSSAESLVALIRAGQVGRPIEVTLLRDGSTRKVAVTPTAAAR